MSVDLLIHHSPGLGTTIPQPQVIVGKTAAALHILNFNIKDLWDYFLLEDSVLKIYLELRQSIQTNPNKFCTFMHQVKSEQSFF